MGGLGPWGVGSANLGRPIFASNFPQTPLKQAFSRKLGAKMGPPNLQIQRPMDPIPHVSMPNKTGRPGYWTMEMNGGSSAPVPRSYPLRFLVL